MKAGLAIILLLASCNPDVQSSEAPVAGSNLAVAYGEMRSARICASLDPTTEVREYHVEVERTENLLFAAWEAGMGAELSKAKRRWEEWDSVTDWICNFQMQDAAEEPSLKLYAEANDAIEAAIAAEADGLIESGTGNSPSGGGGSAKR